ncbi:hypothetical protein ACQKWADRAFT_134560 [Trichoderma austrokoningii]
MDSYRSPWNSGVHIFDNSDEDDSPANSASGSSYRSTESDLDRTRSLRLSGRIISVSLTIPYRLQAPEEGGDWQVNLSNRHDHSVQFDVLTHLSSPGSTWDHITVGWTGEVVFPAKAGNDGAEEVEVLEMADNDSLGSTEQVAFHEMADNDSLGSTIEDAFFEISGDDNDTFGPCDTALPPLEDNGLIDFYSKERLEQQLYHATVKAVPV